VLSVHAALLRVLGVKNKLHLYVVDSSEDQRNVKEVLFSTRALAGARPVEGGRWELGSAAGSDSWFDSVHVIENTRSNLALRMKGDWATVQHQDGDALPFWWKVELVQKLAQSDALESVYRLWNLQSGKVLSVHDVGEVRPGGAVRCSQSGDVSETFAQWKLTKVEVSEVIREVQVIERHAVELERRVEVPREVPVERIKVVEKLVEKEVPVEKKVQVLVPVPQVKQVIEKYPVEVGKRIVEVPVEVVKEVRVEVIKEVEVVKEIEKVVVKEVPVEVIKEIEKIKEVTRDVVKEVVVIKEVEKEVIKEVPVEVIKEVIKEVVKYVEVVKEVVRDNPVEVQVAKPVEVVKEVIQVREVPVEVVKEVVKEVPIEVVKVVEKVVEVEVEKEVIREVVVNRDVLVPVARRLWLRILLVLLIHSVGLVFGMLAIHRPFATEPQQPEQPEQSDEDGDSSARNSSGYSSGELWSGELSSGSGDQSSGEESSGGLSMVDLGIIYQTSHWASAAVVTHCVGVLVLVDVLIETLRIDCDPRTVSPQG